MSYIENEYLNAENRKKAEQLAYEIASTLRESQSWIGNLNEEVVVVAYVLYKASQCTDVLQLSYSDLVSRELAIDEETLCSFREAVNNDTWQSLQNLPFKYASDDFAMVTLLPIQDFGYMRENTTPDSIIKLAQRILACNPGDSVVDIGCGVGTFLLATARKEPGARYVGYEIQAQSKVVACIRAEISGCDVEFRLKDAFNLLDEDCVGERYDKIFSNYPFGLKLRNLGEGSKYLEQLAQNYPGISKATSSDWVFNALLCALLKHGGKAIGIMTNGSTWNSIDTPMRRYFVEQGLVESVISLPNRMFMSTNIATSMIVLSHGNKAIRLVDASKICQQGRRLNEFKDSDIETIYSALLNDSDISKLVTFEELSENEYTLNLSRYLAAPITFENAVPFESVIKSISRGAPCTAKQLDEMVSDEITNMQYLMLANIQNGMIDEKLPYLSHIEPRYEKYCLRNNNLILSKNGYPYKVAVAQVRDGQKILANGNLYIIEIDEEKANPYYLKAFFESEQGISILKSITVGATIPNIGVDKLKKIMIPLPSLEPQERIAQKYQAALDEVAVIKLRLEKALNHLRHVFDEESEVQ